MKPSERTYIKHAEISANKKELSQVQADLVAAREQMDKYHGMADDIQEFVRLWDEWARLIEAQDQLKDFGWEAA